MIFLLFLGLLFVSSRAHAEDCATEMFSWTNTCSDTVSAVRDAMLPLVQDLACIYGNRHRNGSCTRKAACTREWEKLSERLCGCAIQLQRVPSDTCRLNDTILYEVAKAREYFKNPGLSNRPEFRGIHGNAEIDRFLMTMPCVYRKVVLKSYLNSSNFVFPLPKSPRIEDAAEKILEKACGVGELSPEKIQGLKAALKDPRQITRLGTLFLEGPATSQLQRRTAYAKLRFYNFHGKAMNDVQMNAQLKDYWEKIEKPKDSQFQDLLPTCYVLDVATRHENFITCQLYKFIKELSDANPQIPAIHNLGCHPPQGCNTNTVAFSSQPHSGFGNVVHAGNTAQITSSGSSSYHAVGSSCSGSAVAHSHNQGSTQWNMR